MKAIHIHAHGGFDQLRYEDVNPPKLERSADVVVKLAAAAINRIDIDIRKNPNRCQLSFPHILGCDGAGTIATIGSAVRHLKPDDPVCIYPFMGCGRCESCLVENEDGCIDRRILGEHESGTYAEYLRVPAKNCFPIPPGISFEEAAALPLVYATTWRLLVTQGKITPGETILIVGIGGGVTSAALQISLSMGARVIVSSANDDKLAKAKKLGVEQCINHRTMDLVKEVRYCTAKRGVDLVLDCVGGAGWVKSLAALARGGRLLTCGAIADSQPLTDLRRIFWNNLKIIGANRVTLGEFRHMLAAFQCSGIKPIIDSVYPLAKAAKAHERMEKRRQFGKIVLRIAEQGH